jgi:hypothetical protein
MKKRNKYLNILAITILVVLMTLLTNCTSKDDKLVDDFILLAQREGVANCLNFLYFQENGEVIQKSYCFTVDIKYGKYVQDVDTFKIYGLNKDSIKNDLAIIVKKYDRINQVYKRLLFYPDSDTSKNPIIYEAHDIETKCSEQKYIMSNIDISFINNKYSKEDLCSFEESIGSKQTYEKFTLGECYYPNSKKINDTPIVFNRKYKSGIPLKTSYFYYNDSLIVQYHKWSNSGCICLDNITKKDYKDFYFYLESKIIAQFGNPTSRTGMLSRKKKIIWDTNDEHLELHLYLFNSYEIRLIKYWE